MGIQDNIGNDQWYGMVAMNIITYEAEINVPILTNVQERLVVEIFDVYPNPAKDLVHLQFNFNVSKEIKVDLFAINGVKIRSIYHGNIQSGKHVIDFETSNLASGTYIIKTQIDYKKTSQLLIIK